MKEVKPASMQILSYPDPVLRQKSHPVNMVPGEQAQREQLVAIMTTAMLKTHVGVGLSAIQVGVTARMFIVDESSMNASLSDIQVYWNPEIVAMSEETVAMDEGCLSFPDLFVSVVRPKKVTIKAQRIDGTEFTMKADGMVARVIQHEIDHLDGNLLIDQIKSPVKRDMAKRKLAKLVKRRLHIRDRRTAQRR